MAYFTGLGNKDIWYQVIDYGIDYPNNISRSVGEVNYAQLQSGEVELNGKKVPAAPLASYSLARRIAGELKNWIVKEGFTLGEAQIPLPSVEFDREKYPRVDIK
jgi:uncharacterized protein (DUF39 family)